MEKFAIYKTELGFFKIAYDEEVITFFKRLNEDKIQDYGIKTALTDRVYVQLLEYLNGSRKQFDVPYQLKGTDFQMKVWKALCDIPYGETRSYKDIAVAVGNPKASRAVGMANNKNPITVLVPCHRVIGTSGKLVGYAGGLEMKRKILKMEEENK